MSYHTIILQGRLTKEPDMKSGEIEGDGFSDGW